MALSVKSSLGGGSIGSVENLLVPILGTTTQNGVTCTANGDGTYTLNGTASARCIFKIVEPFAVASGSYKLVFSTIDNGISIIISKNNYASGDVDGTRTEKIITVDESITAYTYINVPINTVINNVTVKPMLTTNLKATYKEFVKRVGGFNNLFVPTAPTQTINGITFTNNGNGTYTLNGTTDSSSAVLMLGNASMEDGKQYKLTGCPKGGKIGSAFYYELQYGYPVNGFDYGEGAICQGSSSADTRVWITVEPNTTVNNLVFKPMLTESLLPEYFDFVKGIVEGIISKSDWGVFSKIAVDTYTPTSDIACSSPTIPHSLGAVPNLAMVIAPNDTRIASSYDTMRCLIMLQAYTTTSNIKIATAQFNRLYDTNAYDYIAGTTNNVTPSALSSYFTATTIRFNSSGASWTGHFKAGNTYKIITAKI